MSVSIQSTYALRADVVATVMGEGAVLLDLRTKYFYSANGPAWAIISAFEMGASADQVLKACLAESKGLLDERKFLELMEQLLAEDSLEVRGVGTEEAEWDGAVLKLASGWGKPELVKHKEPLQRIMMSAFDPTIPLAE